MNRLTENKIVLVTRPTRLGELVARFNTVAQARFYVEHLGADFSDYQKEDETYRRALREAQTALAQLGRVQTVDRGFLPNFTFGPDDFVVILGQDGLVANTLKYLKGQPVVGVNPDPPRWDGQLLPFRVKDLPKILAEVFARHRPTKSVTMVKATLNNAQTMYAVNDLFIGPKSHVSARYIIQIGKTSETHSSSGVIVSTGLGSTGWLKSLLTGAAAITQSAGAALAQQAAQLLLPAGRRGGQQGSRLKLNVKTEFPWDADYLRFTVREPFPTRNTGATLVFGKVTAREPLILVSQMAENGVIFSDGIEKDFVEFNSGTKAVITVAERKGILVV
jgi:NAD kinase